MRKVETIVSCLAVRRVAVIAIALGMAFTTSAQWSFAKEVDPKAELTYFKNGVIKQDGYLLKPRQVREVMYGNREALHLYNSGTTQMLIGRLVILPGSFAAVTGLGLLVFPHLFGMVNDENRTGILMGSGILIGIGAVGIGTGFVLASSGEKKIRNAVLQHNFGLRSDATYQFDFGITPTGGVGLTLRF